MWRKKIQILAALSATISEISDGMQYGWSAPITPILLSNGSPISVNESQIVWIETTLLIGTIVGIPITILMLENFGRKQAILMATVQNLVSWILIGCTSSINVIYLARFLSGIAASVVFAAAPIYVAEIADKEIRGFLSSFFSLSMLGGILLVYCVVPFVSIPISSAVGATFLILQLITFPFLPESPYYQIIKGRIGSARRCLQKLRGVDDIESELQHITEVIAKDELERKGFLDLFTVRANRKALMIIIVLNSAQHLAGISVMLMNLHTILQSASSSLSPSSRCIDKLGRRPTMLFSCFTTGLVLILLAAYLTVNNNRTNDVTYGWIPVVLVLIYAGAFRGGMGLIPIILTAEVFSNSVKSVGVSLSEASFTIVSYIAVFIFPYLVRVLGMKGPFYLFGITCFLTGVFVVLVVPETKGKSLHEVHHLIETTPLLSYNSTNSLNNNFNRTNRPIDNSYY
ncbi:hypothetical protein FQR65_LT06575 [Abscondita terminalis]|nr:hypothetical protein FQR65_LT06575 [Abscondita terminalis]